MKKVCEICGQPSGMFPLCKYHNSLKDEGLVIKDDFSGWIVKEEENKNCLICNKPTFYNYMFCKDCYELVKKEIKNFDHNRSENNIYKHYFDLKDTLKTAKNINEFNEKIILLEALAEEYYNIYSNFYLRERVKRDVLKEYKKYENFSKLNNNIKNKFNDEDFRNKWPREHQCDDGHYVRSYGEMLIDNWLYTHDYIHAYEKSVFMDTEPDAVVLSDFYVPKGDVYIEYWGIEDDEKYLKRKNEKIKLYDENGYNRIDLDEKSIKRLNDILPKLLYTYIKKK